MAWAPPDAPISTAPVDSVQVSRDLAWREGCLVFDNEPLAGAAQEFARTSAIGILISRPVAISLDLQLKVTSGGVRVSREEAKR
ncbi:MAG TPA: hypothetical protein VNN98_06285 [Rhizomicrobium sp.]|nr:hypothetical protein [Rhizomicrobium sp.]